MRDTTTTQPGMRWALGRGALSRAWLLDAAIVLAFGLVGFASRVPLRTKQLAYWDSFLFARALEDFNVVAHQPQPPGYIFYVMSARLVHWLLGTNANESYIIISRLAATGTIVAVYLVGARLFGRAAGLAAALFALTAVAPWAYSGVTYPYTVLALGSVTLGGLFWLVRERRVAPLLAGLLLGLAGGFRQDLLLFLGPLLLVSLGWRPLRAYLAAGIGGALGVLAWLVPSALASGGFAAYLGALTRQTELVREDTSVLADQWAGFLWNAHHLRVFLVEQTLAWTTVPLVVFLVWGFRHWRLVRDPRARHLLVWTLPALLFYALIHLGDVGYVFSIAPPLFIAAGAGAVAFGRWLGGRRLWQDWRLNLPLGVIVTPALLGWALLAAGPALHNTYVMYHTGQQHSLLWSRCRDGMIANSVRLIREQYSPADTLLVAAGYYQHARYYLPEFETWLYDPVNGPAMRRPVPDHVRHVVAFGHRMLTRGQPNERRTIVSCDITLSVFDVAPGQTVVYQPDELWIEP